MVGKHCSVPTKEAFSLVYWLWKANIYAPFPSPHPRLRPAKPFTLNPYPHKSDFQYIYVLKYIIIIIVVGYYRFETRHGWVETSACMAPSLVCRLGREAAY